MAKKVALQVWSVPKYGTTAPHVRFLGPVRGIITHYNGKHPEACPGPETCKFHKSPGTWKGFAPGQVWEQLDHLWWPYVIEISAGLIEVTGTLDLRGQVWNLYRVRRSYGSNAIEGEFIRQYDVGNLPRPFDVVPTVERLLKSTTILWDVPPDGFLRDTAECSADENYESEVAAEIDTKDLAEEKAKFARYARNFGKQKNGTP